MKVFKKVINIVIDVLVVLILLVSALILTLSLASQDTGSPNLLGYTLNTIQTGSMEPEFYAGDLLIGKTTDIDGTYNKGDIVFFESSYKGEDGIEYKMVKCHRIVKTKDDNGIKYYLTRGDNNKISDAETDGWLTADKIVGVYQTNDYQGKKLEGVGSVIDYLQSFWGFFFVIVLPMILFFIYELVRVIRNVMAYTKEKAIVAAKEAAENAELSEAQKQKAIEEYLASQKVKEGSSEEEKSNDQE